MEENKNIIASSEAITKQIERNRVKVDKLTEEITRLSYSDEKTEAIQNKTVGEFKKYSALAKENTEAINKLSDNILKLKIANAILKDNYKIAVVNEALPIIEKAFFPYQGKSYGEKTRQKIYDVVKKSGYVFYLSGACIDPDMHYMHIAKLNSKGCAYGSDYIDVCTKNYNEAIVTIENKINYNPDNIAFHPEKYVTDINKRVTDIMKAYRAHEKELQKAIATREALNSILPEKAQNIPDISTMYSISYYF